MEKRSGPEAVMHHKGNRSCFPCKNFRVRQRLIMDLASGGPLKMLQWVIEFPQFSSRLYDQSQIIIPVVSSQRNKWPEMRSTIWSIKSIRLTYRSVSHQMPDANRNQKNSSFVSNNPSYLNHYRFLQMIGCFQNHFW